MSRQPRVQKDFTYYSIIKEAIASYPSQRATSNQIFAYVVAKHPELFKESNAMTWKGNIRQLLSKSPEFTKLPKGPDTKLHSWEYKSMEIIKNDELRLSKFLETPTNMEYRKENDKKSEYAAYGLYYDYFPPTENEEDVYIDLYNKSKNKY